MAACHSSRPTVVRKTPSTRLNTELSQLLNFEDRDFAHLGQNCVAVAYHLQRLVIVGGHCRYGRPTATTIAGRNTLNELNMEKLCAGLATGIFPEVIIRLLMPILHTCYLRWSDRGSCGSSKALYPKTFTSCLKHCLTSHDLFFHSYLFKGLFFIAIQTRPEDWRQRCIHNTKHETLS